MEAIGQVKEITGAFKAVGIDGTVRELEVGDTVYKNERIVSSDENGTDDRIVISMSDGSNVVISGKTDQLLDEQFIAGIKALNGEDGTGKTSEEAVATDTISSEGVAGDTASSNMSGFYGEGVQSDTLSENSEEEQNGEISESSLERNDAPPSEVAGDGSGHIDNVSESASAQEAQAPSSSEGSFSLNEAYESQQEAAQSSQVSNASQEANETDISAPTVMATTAAADAGEEADADEEEKASANDEGGYIPNAQLTMMNEALKELMGSVDSAIANSKTKIDALSAAMQRAEANPSVINMAAVGHAKAEAAAALEILNARLDEADEMISAINEKAVEVGDIVPADTVKAEDDMPYKRNHAAFAAAILGEADTAIDQMMSEMPESTIAAIDASQLAALDESGMLASLTDDQVASLNPALLDSDAIRLLADNGLLGGLTAAQAAALGVDSLDSLTAEEIAQLPATFIAALDPATLASLSDEQLAALTAEQVAALTAGQIDALTPDQIKALGDDVSSLSDEAIASLDADQVKALAEADLLNGFTAQKAAHFAAESFDKLTANEIAALKPELVGGLDPQTLASFEDAQIAALTLDQLAALTSEQIAALTAGQIDALTPDQIKALGDDVSSLSDEAIASLDADQVKALAEADLLNGFTAQKAAHFAAESFDKLTANEIAALKPELVGGLDPQTLASFEDVQLGALTPEQIAALTAGQIDALTPDQIKALGDDVTSLSNEAIASLDADQLKVLAEKGLLNGLTAEQVTHLAAESFAAVSSMEITFLDTGVVGALAPQTLASFSNEQLEALTSDQVGALTAEQIDALTPEQIKALGDDVMSLSSEALSQSENKVIALDESDPDAVVEGGDGHDTIVVSGNITEIDASKLKSIETIQLSENVDQVVNIGEEALARDKTLTIEGSEGDAVILDEGLIKVGTKDGYDVYMAEVGGNYSDATASFDFNGGNVAGLRANNVTYSDDGAAVLSGSSSYFNVTQSGNYGSTYSVALTYTQQSEKSTFLLDSTNKRHSADGLSDLSLIVRDDGKIMFNWMRFVGSDDSRSSNYGHYSYVTTDQAYAPNVEHTLVISVAPGSVNLYVDGEKADVTPGDRADFNNIASLDLDSLKLGTNAKSNSFFQGEIDRFDVFDHALSESEAVELGMGVMYLYVDSDIDVMRLTDVDSVQEGLSGMTPEEIAVIPRAILKQVSVEELLKLTHEQINALSKEQVQALNDAGLLESFSADQIAAIRQDVADALKDEFYILDAAASGTVDGGDGKDILIMTEHVETFDTAQLKNIEIVKIEGTGTQTLNIKAEDLTSVPLKVLGTSEDRVVLDKSFVQAGVEDGLNVYKSYDTQYAASFGGTMGVNSYNAGIHLDGSVARDKEVFTMSVWFQGEGTILQSDAAGGEDGPYKSGWYISTRGIGKATPSGYKSVEFENNISDDSPHHMLVVMDHNGMATVYLDGVKYAEGDISGANYYHGQYYADTGENIGAAYGGEFTGTMSKIEVYGRALDANEIGLLSAEQDATVDNAELSLDFSSESPFVDLSGNNHTIEVNGQTTQTAVVKTVLVDPELTVETEAMRTLTEGDDTVAYSSDMAFTDGAEGTDTFIIDEAIQIDFGAIAEKSANMEQLNLGNGAQSVQISLADVLDITDENNTMRILGDDSDTVSLNHEGSDAEWNQKTDENGNAVTTTDGNGNTYNVYEGTASDKTVTLEVDSNITVTDF